MTIPERIVGSFPLLRFRSEGNFEIPDYFKYGVLFIVSDRLKSIIEKYCTELQVFEVDFEHNGKPLDYFVIHLLDDVDFISEKESGAVLEDNGYIEEIERLVIDESKIADKNLITTGKYLAHLVIVSEELKDDISASGCVGVRFVQPGSYVPW